MAIDSIEKLLSHANGSVYRLVRMAARRALELSEGQPPLIKNPTTDKPTTTALEEIAQGKVVYRNGKTSKVAPEAVSLQETKKEEADNEKE